MHRDIKPANILLSDNFKAIPKIADFGSIKKDLFGFDNTILVGTQRYYAPEKLIASEIGDYSEKVDVWAMGIVFHEMLTGGEHPF